MIAAVFAILAQTVPVAAQPEVVKGPVAMTRAEIKAYNATLQRDHPNYIRCVRSQDTGSLVKKTTSCRTNAEWKRVDEIGNDDASRIIERVQTSGSTSSSG